MRGLFLISVASLLYELVLTRVYALAQGHHFAFMAIAAALLGIGASGTLASRSPRIRSAPPASVVAWCGAGVAATAGLAYVTADRFPFDAYRVGVDAWQLLWLAAYFLVAGVPFVFAGLATIVTLAADPARARLPYFINLVGAGLGALLAVAVVTVLAPAAGVAVAATIAALALPVAERRPRMRLAGLVLVGGLAALAGLTASTGPRLSPYADLSHLLRRPGAERVATYRSPGSQVDVVRGARQRSAPGLSLAFLGDVPLAAHTVTVDGSDSAVADAPLGDYLAYLPLAPLLQARPVASALVLAPVGGPEVGVLLAHGVRAVTVVQPDAAVVRAWEHAPPDAPLRDPRVRIEMRGVREALAGGSGYDLVLWPLRESFQGVAAGAFSLRETYAMTVEAYRDAWRALNPHGVLLLSRWTQAGPTEAVRAWATLRAALAEVRTPEEQLLAWRSLETVTLAASPTPLSADEQAVLDGALQRLRFDWVYRPGLTPEAANRFNVLPDDALYQAFQSVVTGRAPDAGGFDVSPVRDDRPYFFHFFQWSQTSAVLAQLGATWQPFGGAGFLILVPLGGAAMLAALVLIVAPLAGGRRFHLPGGEGQVEGAGGPGGSETRPYPAQSGSVARLPLRLTYFAGAGAGYTFVQLALLQRLILLLDLPTIAFAVGLGALLVWSGLGGLRWGRAATRPAVGAAAAAVATMAVLGMSAFGTAPLVGAPAWARGLVGVIALLPAGLAMGAVLPAGLAALAGAPRGVTAWAWAINGVASVSAAVAATIVLVTFGFAATMAGGAFWYGLAAVCWLPTRRREALRPAL